jgi:hypothetical protein
VRCICLRGLRVPVLLLGINQRPAHGFCIICAVLSEHVPDPAELVELRGAIAAIWRQTERGLGGAAGQGRPGAVQGRVAGE